MEFPVISLETFILLHYLECWEDVVCVAYLLHKEVSTIKWMLNPQTHNVFAMSLSV